MDRFTTKFPRKKTVKKNSNVFLVPFLVVRTFDLVQGCSSVVLIIHNIFDLLQPLKTCWNTCLFYLPLEEFLKF